MRITDTLAIRTQAISRKITRQDLRKLLWAALDRIEELEGGALLASAITKPKS